MSFTLEELFINEIEQRRRRTLIQYFDPLNTCHVAAVLLFYYFIVLLGRKTRLYRFSVCHDENLLCLNN